MDLARAASMVMAYLLVEFSFNAPSKGRVSQEFPEFFSRVFRSTQFLFVATVNTAIHVWV
jgi:hypothetical protein